MTAGTVAGTKNKAAQKAEAKRATLELFLGRKPFEDEYKFDLDGQEVTMLLRSISAPAYDKLIDQCPPTKEQLADGGTYNQDKFMPLLMSKVSQDPLMTAAEWTQIFTSDSYGRGEVNELFFAAVNVCNRQLGLTRINPTENG